MWNVICCLVSAWAQPAHVPTQPQLHPGLPVSRQRLGLHPDRGNPSQGQTSRQTFHHTHPHEDWLPGARDHGAGHGHEPTEVRSRGHSVEQNSTQGQCIYCFFLYSSSNNFDEDLLICSIYDGILVVSPCFCMKCGFFQNETLRTYFFWDYCIFVNLVQLLIFS